MPKTLAGIDNKKALPSRQSAVPAERWK